MVRALVVGVMLWMTSSTAWAQQAIYVVRHAEKVDESRDSPLNDTGSARARALYQALKDAGVTHVYVTEYRRTRLTAQPLLDALHLQPTVMPAGDTPALVRALRKHGPTDVVLVVGHSDTVPELVALWTEGPRVHLAHPDYDNLFLVIPDEPRKGRLVRLHYGAPAP